MTVGETTESTAESRPAKIGRPDKAGLAALSDTTTRIRRAVESVIEGKRDTVRLAITVMLAEGHLLIEDVPGVGKTMLAKALARSVDCSVRRVQFTPDLLPSDITGVSIYNQERREFEFKPGAIFANIVVGDEINRASPKTQSALLECMEERQVTVDGETYELALPFMVLATQNPIEMEGTYPLPEAQRDRFMVRLSMGYPNEQAELQMLDTHGQSSPLDDLTAGLRRDRDRRADPDRARRARLRPGTPVRRRPGARHPQLPRAPARRLTARHPAPDPRRTGRRRPRRPRLRAARRRPGPRRRGARPPAAADRGGADRPALDRGHRHRHRGHACRCPTRPATGGAPSSARRAPGPDHPRTLASSPPGSPSWSPPSRPRRRTCSGWRSCCSRCRWSARWWWPGPATGSPPAAGSARPAPPPARRPR